MANSFEGRESVFPGISASLVPRLNTIVLRNVVQGSSRLALKVTGGVAASQTGYRTDVVLIILALQAAESENYRSPRLISSFQKKIKPGSV